MNISNRLVKHFAACAAAVATVAVVGSANAAVVTWNLNQVVPNTFDGLYINVETGGTAGLGGGIPGWDLNPYGVSPTSMSWFNATGTGMYRSATQTGTASVAIGTVIGLTSQLFTGGTSSTTAAGGGWVLNATNYFGFRFAPAAGGTVYGYGSMNIGAHMGSRFINFVSFETNGTGITVVPTPGAIALVGLAGLISRRRRS